VQYRSYLMNPSCMPRAAGLSAHSKPSVAFPIMFVISAAQGCVVLLAAVLRPFTSTVLNVLEAACGMLDTATLGADGTAIPGADAGGAATAAAAGSEGQREGGSVVVSCRLCMPFSKGRWQIDAHCAAPPLPHPHPPPNPLSGMPCLIPTCAVLAGESRTMKVAHAWLPKRVVATVGMLWRVPSMLGELSGHCDGL
jgi:hypothetical protein